MEIRSRFLIIEVCCRSLGRRSDNVDILDEMCHSNLLLGMKEQRIYCTSYIRGKICGAGPSPIALDAHSTVKTFRSRHRSPLTQSDMLATKVLSSKWEHTLLGLRRHMTSRDQRLEEFT